MAMLFERPGLCSTIGGGGVSDGSSPGVIVETKVNAEVVSGRKRQELGQCRGSSRGCHGSADLVNTIVGGRQASGVGWGRGGWSSWRRNVVLMSPKGLSPATAEVGGLASRQPWSRYHRRDGAGWLRRETCRRCPVAAGEREGSKTWRGCHCKRCHSDDLPTALGRSWIRSAQDVSAAQSPRRGILPLREAVSPKSLAFSDIIYCLAQL